MKIPLRDFTKSIIFEEGTVVRVISATHPKLKADTKKLIGEEGTIKEVRDWTNYGLLYMIQLKDNRYDYNYWISFKDVEEV